MPVPEQSNNTTEMQLEIDAKRVYWHSRRGMLELDLILVPFVEQQYRQLSEEDRASYQLLLECEDTDIYAWLMGRGKPDSDQLQLTVQRIVQHAKQAGSQTQTFTQA